VRYKPASERTCELHKSFVQYASLLLLVVVIPKTDERNERLKVVVLSSNIQTGSQVDKFKSNQIVQIQEG
jgi:hypothetical protein